MDGWGQGGKGKECRGSASQVEQNLSKLLKLSAIHHLNIHVYSLAPKIEWLQLKIEANQLYAECTIKGQPGEHCRPH